MIYDKFKRQCTNAYNSAQTRVNPGKGCSHKPSRGRARDETREMKSWSRRNIIAACISALTNVTCICTHTRLYSEK